MSMAESLLAEFNQESTTTRRFLERIPGGQLEWRPHEKSMTAGQLGLHIATVPGAVIELAMRDEVPAPDFDRSNPQPTASEEILGAFEKSVATVQRLLPTIGDDRMGGTWRAMKDGRVLVAMPRGALLRAILLNHWYHHRGQLGVYLRLLGAKVPFSYGPSADEMPDWIS